MTVESINVGDTATIRVGPRTVVTGIDKQPVPRARVHRLGLQGDTVANEEDHGGPDQAVYVYSREDYAYWEADLGRTLAGGAFGENVTVTSFGPGEVRIGDRLRLGPVMLEISAPRIPCSVFATHLGERNWLRRFRDAERPGVYCRVIDEGEIVVGDPVERLLARDDAPTVLDLFRASYDRDVKVDVLQRFLDAPIDERSRADIEQRLARDAR